MPSSSKEGKQEIFNWCKDLPDVKRILDIGVGKGTYYKLFCKNVDVFNTAEWVGIEAWEPYIEEFRLNKKYNTVINSDVRTVDFDNIGKFDIVFMGDVLEHITKEEAVELVHKLSSKTKYAVISIPIVHYPQDEVNNNPYEVHVKDDWSHTEVMESFPNIEKTFQGKEIGCYFINFLM
jgi:SAM-dependent methyltransferase